MKATLKPIVVLLFFILLNINFAKAQEVRSITEGLSAQLYGNLDNWRSNSLLLGDIANKESNGRGFGAEFSYGITGNIEVFGGYNYSNFNLLNEWEVYRIEHYTLGGQYNFGASRQNIRPYLNVAIGSNNLKLADVFIEANNQILYDNAEMITKGISGNIGGGILYFPIPELAIDLGLLSRFGRFSTVLVNTNPFDQDQNVDFRFIAIRLGASYYFF